MKTLLTILLFIFIGINTEAQLLKKIKQKAEQAVNKKVEGSDEKKEKKADSENTESSVSSENDKATETKSSNGAADLKVYSKFDFVPGSNIIYFDNFEKDNTGEAPAGWITSSSAEVVTIDGLPGNWLQMNGTSTKHFLRSKKQSWGNNFTVEFDLLIVKKDYDPRIDFALLNTGGNLVTDEKILNNGKYAVYVGTILGDGGKKTRVSLYNNNNINSPISDNMSEKLIYSNTVPVHISICVQGKRFRFWWDEKKVYDLQAVNEEYMPNQFGFSFGSVGGSAYYVSNIRVAKDVPDTRKQLEQGKLVSNLLFYTGTANLRPESMGALLDLSKVLKEAKETVKIVGHTDSDGSDASNQKLSEQRAQTVKNILVSQYNIEESKLITEGRGASQPVADNKSAEGKAQNRRVEFIFNPSADVYAKPTGIAKDKTDVTIKNNKPSNNNSTDASGMASVKLESKILTINLPFAQIMKTGENTFTFMASKEEGNYKENFFKIMLQSVNTKLKPETFNFNELNKKNELYGTKQFAEIKNTEAALYYGAAQKPYIYKFSPIIANGAMASYVSESLIRNLPAPSANTKLVIEKVEDGKASGYFVMGIMIQGLKPVKKGDAMTETFTDGFSGELKCRFTNIPVY